VDLRVIGPDDLEALTEFFRRVPEGDRTFFNEDVLDPDVVRSFTTPRDGDQRLILIDEDGSVAGWLAIFGGVGWSSHVGRLAVVVDPARRGEGLGRRLARESLQRWLKAGYSKLVVEVVADQRSAIAMFQAIGFDAEALLRDHVIDRAGTVRDLVVLAHHADQDSSEMQTLGLAAEVA
jgi:L-amino acid N-acyltransferase YncA